jgi:hypothetical protein
VKNRSRKFLGAAVAVLLPVLAMTATYTRLATLQQDTTLRRGPDGATSGFLPAGMDVEVLREQDGWLLVRLEGWVPADAVAGGGAEPAATDDDAGAAAAAAAVATGAAVAAGSAEPAAANTGTEAASADTGTEPETAAAAVATGAAVAAAAEPAAVTPVPVPAAAGAIEGLVKLKTGRKKAKPMTGVAVYLLPGDPGEDLLLYDEANAQKISELQADAARLKREADKAMAGYSFSTATKQHDDLMSQRSRVLQELIALQGAEHGSHAAMAAARARTTAVSNSSGWYTFSSLPPGTYTVYARIANSDTDVEWVERVEIVSGVANLPLDNVNVRGLP